MKILTRIKVGWVTSITLVISVTLVNTLPTYRLLATLGSSWQLNKALVSIKCWVGAISDIIITYLLNFTKIHRKYYKKLSFSFGINLFYALWFGKIRIWFSSPGTTRGLTLLYISRYFSIYLLLFVLILSLLDCC